MKDFLSAARFLAEDFAATILFLAVFQATGSMPAAAVAGIVLGLGQVGWRLFQRRPVDTLQWVSLGLVVSTAGVSLLTNDPRFVMLKPSAIYLIVGAVMLKRGWMMRYMPPIANRLMPDLVTAFGYVWAGLMFASAGLNVALALTLPFGQWLLAMAVWGPCSKGLLFLIQFPIMKIVGRRRYLRNAAVAGASSAPAASTATA